jgi:hypothetical protein
MKKEVVLEKLLKIVEDRGVIIKYKSGMFKGGLVRYDDERCLYLNRKNDCETKIRLISEELGLFNESTPEDIPPELVESVLEFQKPDE